MGLFLSFRTVTGLSISRFYVAASLYGVLPLLGSRRPTAGEIPDPHGSGALNMTTGRLESGKQERI